MSEKKNEPERESTLLDPSIESLLSSYTQLDAGLEAARAEVTRMNNAFNNVKSELLRTLEARCVLLGEKVDRTDVGRKLDRMALRAKRGEEPWS